MTWVQRLKRVFRINIETCAARGGALRIIAPDVPPLGPIRVRGAVLHQGLQSRLVGAAIVRGVVVTVQRGPGRAWTSLAAT